MTTNNKFIYFTGASVEKTRGQNFKVTLVDEETIIYVSSRDIDRVQKHVDEREELIAIILAYIEYIYQSTKVEFQRLERLEREIIDDNVSVILSQLSAEEMIEIIKTVKWHEIIDIFDSKDPAQRIREFR